MTATHAETIAELERANAVLRRERDEREAERDAALAREAALAEVVDVINRSPGDLAPVFDAIMERSLRLCGAAFGLIGLYEDGHESYRAVAMHNVPADFAALFRGKRRVPPDSSFGRMARGESPIHVIDVAADDAGLAASPMRRAWVEIGGIHTTLWVALRKDDDVLGAIVAWRREVEAFSPTQIALLESFAAQAVIAIENARLLGQLRERTGELAERNSAFAERIDHQAATIEVLKELSSSPSDAQPVFDLICAQAKALTDTMVVALFEYDGELIHFRSNAGIQGAGGAAAYAAYSTSFPRLPDRGSPAGRAILDGEMVHVRDVPAEPWISQTVRALGYRTQVSIPLMREGRAIGAISAGSTRVDGISDTQIELLNTFAEQAVIAISSAETYRALQTRTADLQQSLEYQTATSDVLKVISRSTFDLQPVLASVVETASRLCDAEQAVIFRRDGDLFRLAANIGFPPEFEEYWRGMGAFPNDPNNPSVGMRAWREGRTVHIHDAALIPGYPESAIKLGKQRTSLGVPLLREGEVIGNIVLARQRAEPFTDQQIDLVSTFADQAVIAIENTRLLTEQQEALEQQTATAEVLGVINQSPGDLTPVFEAILEKAHRICNVDMGSLWTFDGTSYRVGAIRGYGAQGEAMIRAPSPNWTTQRALLRGDRVFHAPDIAAYPWDPDDTITQALSASVGARSALVVPLRKEGVLIGHITSLRREPGEFSGKEIALLENFAAQAVIAIENARLLGELRERTEALAVRNSEYGERIEQQSATIDVLKAMSGAPDDTQPVFDLIAQSAAELCEARTGLFEFDGTLIHLRAFHGADAAATVALTGLYPRPADRTTSVGRAILERRIVHIRDVASDGDLSPAVGAIGGGTVLSIPLLRDGQPIGVIGLNGKAAGGFSDSQIALLQTFAEQAVIAIGSAETFRELQERTAALAQRNSEFGERIEQQAATIDVLKVMSSTPDDTQPVFDLIVRRAQILSDATTAAIYEYDGRHIHVRAVASDPSASAEDRAATEAFVSRFPMEPTSDTGVGRVVLQRRLVNLGIAGDEDLPDSLRQLRRNSVVGLPLLRDDQPIGAFMLNSKADGGFTDSQIALLRTFAEQAVIAIASAANFRALRERTAELARRQDELRVTFENMGDGVAMFDETRHLVAWNRKFQDMLDVPDEIIAQRQTFAEYIRYLAERGEYGSGADVEEQVRRLLDGAGQMRVLERVRPNGRVIEVRSNPVAAGGFVLIYADITERKRNEAEIVAARDAAEQASRTIEAAFRELKTAQANLVQAEKMASLGQLTAGIAHEIKNPLNFVNNFAELSVDLLGELKDAIVPAEAALTENQREEVDDVMATLTGNLKKITEHGKRADGIVRSMLEHSRGASGERRTVDINTLADEALNLAYHGARAQDQSFNIALERDFGDGIPPIEVNPQDMTRVLLNLFSNGFHAANKRAKNGAGPGFGPTLKLTTRDAGDAVEIHVRDNGTGIPEDIRDKLFQPFFTTKPTGEGTGLGLSITYDIITKAHGGTITFDSEVDQFTEFVVRLPRNMFGNATVTN